MVFLTIYSVALTSDQTEKIFKSSSVSTLSKTKHGLSKCRWFLSEELDKLLGKNGQTVQNIGEMNCIAYTKPGNAILTTMGSFMKKSTFSLMKNINKEKCKIQELPHIAKNVYAYYDCPAPANIVMNVDILKNGHQMTVTYQPNGRISNIKDIDYMETLLKHIIKTL